MSWWRTSAASAERRLLDDGSGGARPMMWVMAVMLYLTVLAAALAVALIRHWLRLGLVRWANHLETQVLDITRE